MQYRLLDLVRCPSCKADLQLDVFATGQSQRVAWSEGKRCRERCAYVEAGHGTESNCFACSRIEVVEGTLRCQCGKTYQIIGGVPRLLPDDLQAQLVERYSSFFSTRVGSHRSHLSRRDRAGGLSAQTVDAFGYEWTEFSEYDAQNFLELVYPLQPDYFRGKLGLDCGCGAGRHTGQAVSYGAEMVAIDISWAVDSAYEKNMPSSHAMVVQCDVFNLPFKEGRFDFIYSLGVLHHTTNQPKAFDCLVPLLRPGGGVALWIYANKRKFLLFALKVARMVTRKMPYRMVKWVSFMAACIDFGIFIWPYKLLRRTPGLGEVLEKIAPPRVKGYAKYDFLVSFTDWFDRLSYPCVNYYGEGDVRAWYERNNLTNVRLSSTGPFAWRGFGTKPEAGIADAQRGDE